MKNLVLSTFAAVLALAPLPLMAKSAHSSHTKTESHSDSAHFTAKIKFIEIDENKKTPFDLDELNQIKGAYLLTAPIVSARNGHAASTKVTTPFRAQSHFDNYDFSATELGVAFEIAARKITKDGDTRTEYALHTTARNLSKEIKTESGRAMHEVTSRDYFSTGSVANGRPLWIEYANPFLHKKLIVYVKFSWSENDDEAPSHKHSTTKKKSHRS